MRDVFRFITASRIVQAFVSLLLIVCGYFAGSAGLPTSQLEVVPPQLSATLEYYGTYGNYIFEQENWRSVKRLDEVEILKFRKHTISDSEWNVVCKMENLIILDLSSSSLTEQQFRRLTELQHLRILYLDGMKISKEIFDVLLSLRHVHSLSLAGSNLDHESIMKLTESLSLDHLIVSKEEAEEVAKDLKRPGHLFFKIRTESPKWYFYGCD